ncbi:MAG: hypothetical protein J1D87_04205, partial [Lachnospiraceae bacterium]|nr:hypothetical protein [Lachnospiraceae bacterium]
MSNKYTALEGKIFVVDLPITLGSSNYGWCLKTMPKEIILIATEHISLSHRPSIGTQRFYFGVISSEETKVTLEFALTCISDIKQVSEIYKVDIDIISANSDEYKTFSENETPPAVYYGFVYNADCLNNNAPIAVEYGYPYDVAHTTTANIYAYPFSHNNAAHTAIANIYAYPFSHNNAAHTATANIYAYPFSPNNAAHT